MSLLSWDRGEALPVAGWRTRVLCRIALLLGGLIACQTASAVDLGATPAPATSTPTIDLSRCRFVQRCMDIGRCTNHRDICRDGYCCSGKTPRPTRTPWACLDRSDCFDPVNHSCVDGFCVAATPTPRPTPDPECRLFACLGDCGGDDSVSINDLLVCVDLALRGADPSATCAACSVGGGRVTVADLVGSVGNAQRGCLAPGCRYVPGLPR